MSSFYPDIYISSDSECPAFTRIFRRFLKELLSKRLRTYTCCMDKKQTSIVDCAEPIELRKPHEMIVMMPIHHRLTLTGRRIYNSLLQVSQLRLAAMTTMPLANFVFEAPLPAILRATGSGGEDRTAAKRYLTEMLSSPVEWHAILPGDGKSQVDDKVKSWHGLTLLSQVSLEIRNGENWVSWAFPPLIMSALSLSGEGARWAQIDLNVLATLNTYTSVALYEICARFRDNPGGATTKKPTQWWIKALSQGPGELRTWRKFKSEKIKDAVIEINAYTDLEIELFEDKKGGRSVVDVQFLVRRKRVASGSMFKNHGAVDANLVLRAETLGIRESKLESLFKEFGEELVREKIHALERRTANEGLRSIENAFAYLLSLLRNDDVIADEFAAGAKPLQIQPLKLIAMPSALQVKTQGDLEAERIAILKTEFMKLPLERRCTYVDAALKQLAVKRQLSPVIKRRAGQGDVLHGLLGSVIAALYGLDEYGKGWKNSPENPIIS